MGLPRSLSARTLPVCLGIARVRRVQVRNSVQEADAAVDQHALEAEARPVQACQPLRRVAGRQAPPGSQSRELLYSVPAEEIACAATEELAEQVHFFRGFAGQRTFFLVQHRDARAGERHQLVGHQVDEQVRHRAVQALEIEPGKVAQAGADTTQWHLGHALRRKAGNEAVAQVAHTADVNVARRLPSCICDSRRLSSCLAAPMGATS